MKTTEVYEVVSRAHEDFLEISKIFLNIIQSLKESFEHFTCVCKFIRYHVRLMQSHTAQSSDYILLIISVNMTDGDGDDDDNISVIKLLKEVYPNR